MRQSDTAIVVSGEADEENGYAYIGDKVKVPIKIVPRKPVDFGNVAKAEASLAMANALHLNGDHRQAFMWSVRAAREMFSAVGTDDEMQEPFKHLFSALQDIDLGRVDNAFKPPPTCNRKIEPSSEWEARACLAAALQARMALGESEREAAEYIRRRIPIVHEKKQLERSKAVGRLMEWRKQFRSAKPPPAGGVIFRTAVEQIERTLRDPNPKARREWLTGAADMMVNWALERRQRLSPTTLDHE